jgi:predicted RNase H-like nuclease
VVVTTRRLQAAVAARAPRSEILAAGRAAQRSHQRARAAAQASYEGARRIMEPRLSLFEGISAIRDYDAMLGRFDDLRDRIDAVVATVD